MGFSKHNMPSDVTKIDTANLSPAHRQVMADWLGVRQQYLRLSGAEARSKALNEWIKSNPVRAQEGYDIVVLGKQPAANGVISVDVEQRMYQTLTGVINEHKEALGEKAFKAVDDAVRAVTPSLLKVAKQAIDEAAERARPIVVKQEGKKDKKVKGVLPAEFERILQLASARIPILLVGPAGCGKTYICEKVAEALALDYSDNSCSEGMSESVFNGRLLPIGKGGAFEHVASPFMERYENGGVHLLDEMDAGDPNLFTYINKAIANTSYTVAERHTKPVVKKHKDFVLVAAANTFGNGADAMYVGRNQLDAATIDRFKVGMVTMDYAKNVEESIGGKELCEWAWRIRAAIRQNKLRRIMSTRVIKDLATMTEMYKWGPKEWAESYFTGWTTAERTLVGG